MDHPEPFTPAQEDALRKVYGILSEHFHNALIVAGAKRDAPDNAPATHGNEVTRVLFVGSHKEALGNVTYASAYLGQCLRNFV